MNIDQFWEIVERVDAAVPGDMPAKCRLLADELRQLPPGEIEFFEHHFSDCFYRAYSEDLWGAAYVINGGCSDDSFMDFRSTLISLGRTVFERALTDPDSLAEVDIDPAWATFEGYQYVARKVYEQIAGARMPNYSSPFKAPLAGIPFDEGEMSPRYPKLVPKYGYKDADPTQLKAQREGAEKRRLSEEHVAQWMLNSRIIPSCGLIPPFRVMARVAATGMLLDAEGQQHTWEPFHLDEGDYWSAVSKVQKLAQQPLPDRPDITGKLKLDVHGPHGDDFGLWIESLRQRGQI